MRTVSGPRSRSDSAPVLIYGRADEGESPPSRWWRTASLRRPAVALLVLAAFSIQPLQAGIGDERNIEQYATRRAQPTYPPLAQKQRIEGAVVIQVAVGTNGKVTNAEFVRGNNIFKSVSLEAARRWEFKVPIGEGIEGTIRFTFKLE